MQEKHKNTGRWEGVEPLSQLNNTRGSGDAVQSRMWDGMSSGVLGPAGISGRYRAGPEAQPRQGRAAFFCREVDLEMGL
jgi:hypothetical protein